MGSRGASSGISKRGNKYGSQYHTLYEAENIKFVAKNTRESETLMETMTPGRVYATVAGDRVIYIMTFDKNNKRMELYDLKDKRAGPHIHYGYEHNETKPPSKPNATQQRFIDKVTRIWENRK